MEQKHLEKEQWNIYARALDNIYAALKGTRIIVRFEFNLPKRQKKPAEEPPILFLNSSQG